MGYSSGVRKAQSRLDMYLTSLSHTESLQLLLIQDSLIWIWASLALPTDTFVLVYQSFLRTFAIQPQVDTQLDGFDQVIAELKRKFIEELS